MKPTAQDRAEKVTPFQFERLMGIRKQRVKVAEVEFDQVTQADQEQQRILDLMKVKL